MGPRSPRGSAGPPVALFAGRLLPWKGIPLALRAMAELPEWRLVIIGSGPDERRLRRFARRLGLEGRVEFRGWRSRQEVLRAMREEADVFLFPSLHDEAPFVVAEALASGLPVVCLDHGGPAAIGRLLGESRDAHLLGDLARAMEAGAGVPVLVLSGIQGAGRDAACLRLHRVLTASVHARSG